MRKDNNFKLLIIAFVVLIIFMAFSFVFFLDWNLFGSDKNNTNTEPVSSGTGVGVDTNPSHIQKNKESSEVMNLLDKTPHYGDNFAFFYSYDGNYFTLYVNPANSAAGNAR